MKKLLTLAVALCLSLCAMFALTACDCSNDDLVNFSVEGKTFAYNDITDIECDEAVIDSVEEFVTSNNLDTVTITFNNDGTFVVYPKAVPSGYGEPNPLMQGTWRRDGNGLTITVTSGQQFPDEVEGFGIGNGKVCVKMTEENEGQNYPVKIWFKEYVNNVA